MRLFYGYISAMKVLSTAQIRAADQFTIAQEPIASIDLMERASRACSDWLFSRFGKTHFYLFCGPGNNGGDGLAIARLLLEKGADVHVWLIHFSDNRTEDNQINAQRLKDLGVPVHAVHSEADLPEIPDTGILIDALVGTGLTRSAGGLLLSAIDHLNRFPLIRVAIDVPSGFFTEADNETDHHSIFRAEYTLTFQVPRLCFFLPSMFPYVGRWFVLDIGLNAGFLRDQHTPFQWLLAQDARAIYRPREPFAHKGTYGHALIISGSHGKMGAAVLASRAALRAGCGLVSAMIPACGYTAFQTAVPEAMAFTSPETDFVCGKIPDAQFSAIGAGPGLGQSDATSELIHSLLKHAPLVLDADALNILASHPEWLTSLPQNTILTPHVKEFDRLFGTQRSAFARLMHQQEMARRHHCIIVLKGHFSSVALPDGTVWFNSTGNPGMATGGSGDVLTGIITGLLASGYSSSEAALLGVYLHGLSGDLAVQETGEEALIASDIIEALRHAFQHLH